MTREEAIDKYMEARNYGVELDTISVINALYDDIESRVCENCKYGELSWIATDGRDIRESQYPPMIECKQIKDKTLKYPNWYCADFSKLSLSDSC